MPPLTTTPPRVTVVLTAADAPGGADALRSALAQTWPELEVLVVGDAPGEVSDGRACVRRLPQPTDADRATALNQALAHARGRYVCYLTGHDVLYPNHVRRLVEALEADAGHGAAYSDAYATVFRPAPGGGREVLGKVLRGGRSAERLDLLAGEAIQPPTLLHRRDLLDQAGPCRQELDSLVDWDLHRRLSFFTDFLYVPGVTAERYVPAPDTSAPPGDRADLPEAVASVLAARPPRPWPKIAELAVVLAPAAAARWPVAMEEIRRRTVVPHRLYLAVTADEAKPLGNCPDDVACVPVGPGWPWDARVDKALGRVECPCVAILPEPPGGAVGSVQDAWHVLTRHAAEDEAIRIGPAGTFAGVFRTEQLLVARRRRPALSIRRSIEADGIVLRSPRPDELPGAFDDLVRRARDAADHGRGIEAAQLYEAAGQYSGQTLWTDEAAARALYRHGGHDEQALAACTRVNARRPTVASLLLEARLLRRSGQVDHAAQRLQRAREFLEEPTHRKGPPC